MNRTQQLDTIEKLVGYTGLGQGKARELLDKCNWNVDAAYRMYKNQRMEQQGFKKPPAQVNRFSEPLPTHAMPRQSGVFARPTTEFYGQFGTATTGTGPAVGMTYHPGFQQPKQVPKFPVEPPKERIIPIQIEKRPQAGSSERQGALSVQNNASVPPTSNKPIIPNKTGMHTSSVMVGDGIPRTPPFPRQNNVASAQNLSQKEDKESRDQPAPLPNIKQQKSPLQQQQTQQQQNKGETQTGSSTPKLLKRGISKISQNAMLVDLERQNVMQDIEEDCHDNMYVQTFILPDVTGYSENFRAFLERDLIELSTLVSLEQAGHLNWWAEIGLCQRLLPMATSGDGNCLLHAASLAMWGIHDRQLMLRKALFDTLTKKYYRQALYRRWRWQQTQANKEAGLIFSEEEWKQEWDNVLRLASSTPRSLPGTMQRKNSCCDSMVTQSNMSSSEPVDPDSPVVYESLEEFHVFVLAHVIQRPIIVVADTVLKDVSGDALAPIPFGGIYLPLECEASHCYRSPLLLTYDAAHFSALVPMDSKKDDNKNVLPVAIPVVNPELEYLPLHFSIDPGINFNWDKNNADFSMQDESKLNLMKRYMDLEKLGICGGCLDSNSDDRNSTGSAESDDGLIDRSKKKDGKVSQQLHSVSKQFGSFGKSVGKKLKNLGKVNKEDKKGNRKLSLTQSTNRPLTISALGELDQSAIWCCKLLLKKSDTHQKMIDNYLYDAGERFKKEMSARQLTNNEIVNRTQNFANRVERQNVPCVTSGCNMYGSAETSYLCSKCYADQKQQLINQEKDLLQNFAKMHKPSDDDATKVGQKSKFYDMKTGDKTAGSQPSHVDLNTLNKGNPPLSPNLSRTQNRNCTPSPDYDNVDYPTKPSHINPSNSVLQNLQKPTPLSPKQQPKKPETKSVGQPCKNPHCTFYGSKDTEFYCSGCYKNKHKMNLNLV